PDLQKTYEAQQLLSQLGNADYLIAMDEKGQNLSSPEFARLIEKIKDNSIEKCHFMIGGAYGLDQSLLKKAHSHIALGKMTWPHMMARLMTVEQIYRAITLLSGHPYHKS
ncbi:MAG: 23S rRNA (pseudouridine(1915)-N(3))-methyltransferase RlmH, partial [Pseudomonadota bacterium]